MRFYHTLGVRFLALLWGLQAVAPGLALAQTNERNPAVAQALFDEAQRLMKARDYAAACPKFKESYELDPGGGTLLNLADCYERQGRTALAWSTFKEALVMAQRDGRKERVKYAREHITSLEGRLAYLTIQVPEAARVQGLGISVDGAPLGVAAWGVALPVDPGERVVRAEAPGKVAFEKVVEVPRATLVREAIEIPVLADEKAPGPAVTPESEPAAAVDTQATVVVDEPSGSSDSTSSNTAAWVVGGVGVAALGVGGFFGLRAFSKWNERNDNCPNGECNPTAVTAHDDANTAATIATVGVGAGVVALGVATYLFLSNDAGGQSGEDQGHGGVGKTARAPRSRPCCEVSFDTREGGGELRLRSTW
jgi:hypothetical protein